MVRLRAVLAPPSLTSPVIPSLQILLHGGFGGSEVVGTEKTSRSLRKACLAVVVILRIDDVVVAGPEAERDHLLRVRLLAESARSFGRSWLFRIPRVSATPRPFSCIEGIAGDGRT